MTMSNTVTDIEEQHGTQITHGPIQTVDLAVLTSFEDTTLADEPDFVVELIDLYLTEAPRLFDSIRDGLEKDDWPVARRSAHSLRGSSGNLGIFQMASIAEDLEHLDTHEPHQARQLLQSLEDEFVRVRKILLQERQRRTA